MGSGARAPNEWYVPVPTQWPLKTNIIRLVSLPTPHLTSEICAPMRRVLTTGLHAMLYTSPVSMVLHLRLVSD